MLLRIAVVTTVPVGGMVVLKDGRVLDRAGLAYYNHDRAHTGRLTQGQIPADIVYGAPKMKVAR